MLNLPELLITVEFRDPVVVLLLFLLQKAFTCPDPFLAERSCHVSVCPTT